MKGHVDETLSLYLFLISEIISSLHFFIKSPFLSPKASNHNGGLGVPLRRVYSNIPYSEVSNLAI